MAIASSSLLSLNSQLSSASSLHRSPHSTRPFSRRQSWLLVRARNNKINSLSVIEAKISTDDVSEKDFVIVGAEIAGLATAVSLQRIDHYTNSLEFGHWCLSKQNHLELVGPHLPFSRMDGGKELDGIGVGSGLRSQFLEIQGMVVKSEDGRELRSFRFKDEDESQEVRAVEILMETLSSKLPLEAVRFSSGLAKMERREKGKMLLELVDGTGLLAKVNQFQYLVKFTECGAPSSVLAQLRLLALSIVILLVCLYIYK